MIEFEDILYLELKDVLVLYSARFECSPEEAADQLRSRDGLESAPARPQQHAYYYQADIATQAAILTHGIAEGQPFVEGNKRTAGDVCITFLKHNGYALATTQENIAAWILDLSAGLSEKELAAHIRDVLIH